MLLVVQMRFIKALSCAEHSEASHLCMHSPSLRFQLVSICNELI
jgi:hypothetical protein